MKICYSWQDGAWRGVTWTKTACVKMDRTVDGSWGLSSFYYILLFRIGSNHYFHVEMRILKRLLGNLCIHSIFLMDPSRECLRHCDAYIQHRSVLFRYYYARRLPATSIPSRVVRWHFSARRCRLSIFRSHWLLVRHDMRQKIFGVLLATRVWHGACRLKLVLDDLPALFETVLACRRISPDTVTIHQVWQSIHVVSLLPVSRDCGWRFFFWFHDNCDDSKQFQNFVMTLQCFCTDYGRNVVIRMSQCFTFWKTSMFRRFFSNNEKMGDYEKPPQLLLQAGSSVWDGEDYCQRVENISISL